MVTEEDCLGLTAARQVPYAADSPVTGLPEAVSALQAMSAAARADGIDLQPVSGWRSFERQYRIFDDKFYGRRPVLNAAEQAVDPLAYPPPSRVRLIMYFSAVPGFSRHHFGTDFDVCAPNLLPPGGRLQLTAAEYAPGAYFCPLGAWLSRHAAAYGFVRPYLQAVPWRGSEPWHLSYQKIAADFVAAFAPAAAIRCLRARPAAWTEPVRSYLNAQPALLHP